MEFLSPEWLFALLFVPLLIIAAGLARRKRKKIWQKIVASRLKQRLVTSHSGARHWISLTLCLIGFCFVVIAAARPYYGTKKTVERTKHRNIMLVMDVSRSMLCQDIQPNRLKASAALSIRILQAFDSDRIGIVAFAGGNLQVAPLTIDHNRLQTTISQLDQNTVGIGGSDVTGAIKTAVAALQKTGQQSNAIVVISDGEHHSESLTEAAEFANKAEIQVFTVGVGNEAGGTIPDTQADDGKYRDSQGKVVHTRFHADVLQELAQLTDGQYNHIHDRPESMIKSTLQSLEAYEQEGKEREVANELYEWFLLPGVAFFLANLLVRTRWRSSSKITTSVSLLACIISLTPQSSEAELKSWFQQKKATYFDQSQHIRNAHKAFVNNNYKDCLEELDKASETASGAVQKQIYFKQGEAYFRSNQFSKARHHYSLAMASQSDELANSAQFNMANSIFQQGWTDLKPPADTSFEQHMQAYFASQQVDEKQRSDEQKKLAALPVAQTVARWKDSVEHFASNPHPNAPLNQKRVQDLLDIIQREQDNAKPEEQQNEEQKEEDKNEEKDENSEQEKQDSDDKDENKEQGEDGKQGEDGEKSEDQNQDGQEQEESEGDQEQSENSEQSGEEEQSDQQSESGNESDQQGEQNSKQDPNASQQSAQQAAQQAANQEQLQALQDSLENQTPEQRAAKILEEYSDMMKAPQARRINRPSHSAAGIDW